MEGYATENWVTSQGYLTAHQDLSDYQTTAGMTAYLTTGDSAEFMTTAERSDYIPTGVSSEFYTTANTAGYISTIPDTYLQNTDLSTEDGKVTAISGIPLSAGGDVPEGVMVESGLEYNAQGYISGYAGSAITGEATIYTDTATMTGQGTISEPFGVKSTDLFVQEPLYTGTSGNSAYIGWNNETVLWSGVAATGTLTASESVLNFDHYKIYISERERGTPAILEFHTENTATSGDNAQTNNGGFKAIALTMFQTTDKDFFTINSNHAVWNDSFTELSLSTTGYNKYMPWKSNGFNQWDNAGWTPTIRIHKIVGVNRKV